jgi:hypothetical protein
MPGLVFLFDRRPIFDFIFLPDPIDLADRKGGSPVFIDDVLVLLKKNDNSLVVRDGDIARRYDLSPSVIRERNVSRLGCMGAAGSQREK